MNTHLNIKAIGGIAQIGSNMTQFWTGQSNFLIDCGILFPADDSFDINYLIPDFDMIHGIPDILFLTHGHEDHIGAICHLVNRYPKIKIYATPFTIELVQHKFKQQNIAKKCVHLHHGNKIELSDIILTAFHVNHSIPDTVGFFIEVPHSNLCLFYASDFKVIKNDPYEKDFDLALLNSLSTPYLTRVLLPDSTNIVSRRDKTPGEGDILDELTSVIAGAPGRVFVTQFASNIHRLQSFFNIAKKLGKKMVLYGGAMKKYSQAAIDTGHLNTHGLDRDVDTLKGDEKDLIILTSGCQGDFKSATRRVIIGEDSHFKLNEMDTYIFSSKAIPGNEKKIFFLYNKVCEQGVELICDDKFFVHVSGHAGRDDLRQVINAFKPTHLIPIHGESYFLKEHANFIRSIDPKIEVVTNFYNGDSIIFDSNAYTINKGESLAPRLIIGNGVEIDRSQVSERRKIAQLGVIFLSIVLQKKSLKDLHVDCHGLPALTDITDQTFKTLVSTCLKEHNPAEEIRIRTRRLFQEKIGIRPIVIVHLFQ